MADDDKRTKCGRDTCDCLVPEGEKFCSVECADAHRVRVMEIGCTCHHPDCR